MELTPEEKDQADKIISQITETAKDSDVKVNVNKSDNTVISDQKEVIKEENQKEIITEDDQAENENENTQEEIKTESEPSADDDSADQNDEEYRNSLLSYFTENCDTFNTAFALKASARTIQKGNDEIVWYDTDTKEIYWCGDAAQENSV